MRARLLEVMTGLATKWRGPDYLAGLYSEMHANGAFPGHSWRVHVDLLRRLVPDLDRLTIVDYGCGPHGGLRQSLGEQVIPFDPFVEAFSTPPWDRDFDLLFSSDVLEHMPIGQIDRLIDKLVASRAQHVFLNISTRPAHKHLPNGANAHLTVKPTRWWLDYLTGGLHQRFNPLVAQADLLRNEATFYFRGKDTRAAQPAESLT
jgi:hypothetical protein